MALDHGDASYEDVASLDGRHAGVVNDIVRERIVAGPGIIFASRGVGLFRGTACNSTHDSLPAGASIKTI